MDPDLPYRSPISFNTPAQSRVVKTDAVNYDTLKNAYVDMRDAILDLDKWHAFELDEKLAGLTIKQQIVAHKKAYEIVAPIFEALESSVAAVDQEFINRMKGIK